MKIQDYLEKIESYIDRQVTAEPGFLYLREMSQLAKDVRVPDSKAMKFWCMVNEKQESKINRPQYVVFLYLIKLFKANMEIDTLPTDLIDFMKNYKMREKKNAKMPNALQSSQIKALKEIELNLEKAVSNLEREQNQTSKENKEKLIEIQNKVFLEDYGR